MKDYVFQFILEPANGQFGLIFSEESDVFQSPVFGIPTRSIDYIHGTFFFPGEINNEYTEFQLKRKRDSFLIEDERIDFELQFQIIPLLNDELYYQTRNLKLPLPYSPYFKYIGKYDSLFNENEIFQILVPMDLMIMDQLFLKKGFCLVGYTPSFNEYEH